MVSLSGLISLSAAAIEPCDFPQEPPACSNPPRTETYTSLPCRFLLTALNGVDKAFLKSDDFDPDVEAIAIPKLRFDLASGILDVKFTLEDKLLSSSLARFPAVPEKPEEFKRFLYYKGDAPKMYHEARLVDQPPPPDYRQLIGNFGWACIGGREYLKLLPEPGSMFSLPLPLAHGGKWE